MSIWDYYNGVFRWRRSCFGLLYFSSIGGDNIKMGMQYLALELSDDLYQEIVQLVSEVKHGPHALRLNKAFSELLIRLIKKGVDHCFYKPMALVAMNSKVRSAANYGVEA